MAVVQETLHRFDNRARTGKGGKGAILPLQDTRKVTHRAEVHPGERLETNCPQGHPRGHIPCSTSIVHPGDQRHPKAGTKAQSCPSTELQGRGKRTDGWRPQVRLIRLIKGN